MRFGANNTPFEIAEFEARLGTQPCGIKPPQ